MKNNRKEIIETQAERTERAKKAKEYTEKFNKKRAERTTKVKEVIENFNAYAKELGSIVYLTLEDEIYFQIKLRIVDALVQDEVYKNGYAVIYPSEVVHKAIEKIAKQRNIKLGWNNNETIGWAS